MIRAIIKRRYKDQCNGLETEGLETLVFDASELEQVLSGGGMSEDGYDIRELVGVEILPNGDSNND